MPNEDQVFVLVGSTALFIPQRDEEILGPANTRNTLTNPECTPGRISLTYCGVCGVSWLVGEKGPDAAASHLSHHTLVHNYSGARRSLVVFIDGACPENGPAALQASVGVYFGPESPKNISRLIDTSRPTNQLAEITAAVEDMRQWTFDNLNRVYCNRRGDVIKNIEGFRILNEETELLSVFGVQVQWYHVPRDFNGEADALANAALRG
ncbi:hypothetical protein FOXB_01953 [Fusarium oxysporum f. sp. conglutinans Fo5176]|uniref:RNase H type-1 domain-containing protein n=1 Tax=Fusarium oxysporum (strain Fo5176) TaxID=660025 RepID=F9F6C8_FUSOF|nr:hypothetical protein FOXB_01953 [Fusarium oxysporum f. sp. conglutinans Fo5176]